MGKKKKKPVPLLLRQGLFRIIASYPSQYVSSTSVDYLLGTLFPEVRENIWYLSVGETAVILTHFITSMCFLSFSQKAHLRIGIVTSLCTPKIQQ